MKKCNAVIPTFVNITYHGTVHFNIHESNLSEIEEYPLDSSKQSGVYVLKDDKNINNDQCESEWCICIER